MSITAFTPFIQIKAMIFIGRDNRYIFFVGVVPKEAVSMDANNPCPIIQ